METTILEDLLVRGFRAQRHLQRDAEMLRTCILSWVNLRYPVAKQHHHVRETAELNASGSVLAVRLTETKSCHHMQAHSCVF